MQRIPVYGLSLVRDSSLPVLSKKATTPAEAFEILKEYLRGKDREHFVVVLLSARQDVIGINTVSIGTVSASLVHPRELFKPAILAGACAVIVAHNHPSGDCSPSPEDKETTRRLVKAGEILGIPVVDHIIVSDNGYTSLKERGLL